MTKRNTDPHRQSPSRRDVLQIFAAGAAGAVGTIALERAPRLNAAAASAGGTLRIAWLTPAQLDPRSVSGMSEIAILNALYDYLFETDAESNLVPALAHAWERNDDGTRYTLQLVEDARFHDGSLLTARDVVWSIQLQLDAGGTIADLLSSVNAVEASGDHSVVFDLNASVPDFLYRLTEYKVVMLKAEAENLGIDFNGTGPFIMEKMIPADRAIMRANPDYWRGAPNIDTLEFLFFDDQQAAIAAVQGGVADGILRLDNFSFLNFSGDVRFNTRNLQANGHDMTRIRADRPPGNDIRVRRAFKLATDRRAVWERVQLGYGAVGKDSPIGPSFPQYFLEDAEPPPRDPVAAAALLLAACVGVTVGIIAALRHNTVIDTLAMAFALVGISMPVYWSSLLLILLFAVRLRLLPAIGQGGLERLILPATALALVSAGSLARMVRSSMLEVLNQDFVLTARAKGVTERLVVVRHVLRNALIPVVTILGLMLGNMLSGAVITETIFARLGIGQKYVEAVLQKDFTMVQGTTLFIALMYVFVNIVVDMIYAFVDPRIRYV